MKFFIDTAKVEDIRKANDMGVDTCGVTTNPSSDCEGGKSARGSHQRNHIYRRWTDQRRSKGHD